MLAKRVIPTMLVRGRTLVKGRQFAGDRSIGHVLQAARVHATRGVDELCILDIAATVERRGPDLEMVRELSDGCFIPITVGGGVRSLGDIDDLLRAGADKVAIRTAAWPQGLIERASARFGSQAIVVAIDVRHGLVHTAIDVHLVQGGPAQAARDMQDAGAGEILLQDIERDGTMNGYNVELVREVSNAVSVPVIASGGCSSYADMVSAFKAGADACAVGALFAFTDATPRGAAQFLKRNHIEVRV
jgi:cyclase